MNEFDDTMLASDFRFKKKKSKYAFSQFCFRNCDKIKQRVTFDSDFAFCCLS